MVQLHTEDIQTREVLDWQGVHLFHFRGSTCSQKVRIFLRLKGIDWHSHHLNLVNKEHQTPYYMGINPRGLVPTLIHDGKVIIESNDILTYLESTFPEPALIPIEAQERMAALLKAEDDLHLPIRSLTMRFVFPAFLVKRKEEELKNYEALGSGTVGGAADPKKAKETDFWRRLLQHGHVPDEDIRDAFAKFKQTLDGFESDLAQQKYLLGDEVTLADIAWYIYLKRLRAAGYPVEKLHPRVAAWFEGLDARPEFTQEVPDGGLPGLITGTLHCAQKLRRSRLIDVVGTPS